MGDSKKARQRQAKGQCSAIRQRSKPNKENVPAASSGPQSYPKPHPVNKKSPIISNTNANDIEDAESAAINALTSLGQHRDNRTLHQTTAWDRAINQALGIDEEEADDLAQWEEQKNLRQELSGEDSDRESEKDSGVLGQSSLLWDEFQELLAEKMGVSIQHVCDIGYLASFIPKNQKSLPKVLEGPEEYENMLNDIFEHIDACKAMYKGRGQRKGQASVDELPVEALHLKGKAADQFKVKAQAKNSWAQIMLPLVMPPWMYSMLPWMYSMLPWMMSPANFTQPVGSYNPPPTPTPVKRPAEPLSQASYPTVTAWLGLLDQDFNCGSDDINYAQHLQAFSNAGLICLGDILACKTVDKIQELTGINWGTANWIMEYAEGGSRQVD
ncbi:hypothetical protein H0H92_002072 [Tricholoma furcatifolium]|nr:hypothetical protein H0H92_002072 [Tricholoma furcatifolium]